MIQKLRSFLFTFLFLIWSAFTSVFFVWTLLLPYNWANSILRHTYNRGIYILEKYVLGLDYKVIGMELLPTDQSYIIAAKHQSAYETFKVKLMFEHAVIILKEELARIPFWGWYTVKVGGIPINRAQGSASLKKLVKELKPALEKHYPVLIYPQGTRIPADATSQEFPYKPGVALIAKSAGNLPIYPMRCNSGEYWPKTGWLNKKGGVVTFEIRPALTGNNTKEVMAQLEAELEKRPLTK